MTACNIFNWFYYAGDGSVSGFVDDVDDDIAVRDCDDGRGYKLFLDKNTLYLKCNSEKTYYAYQK